MKKKIGSNFHDFLKQLKTPQFPFERFEHLETYNDMIFESSLHYCDASMSVDLLHKSTLIGHSKYVLSTFIGYFQAARIRYRVKLTSKHGMFPILIAHIVRITTTAHKFTYKMKVNLKYFQTVNIKHIL